MIHVNAFHSITLVIFRQFKVNKQRYEHHGAYIQTWFINRQPKIFKRDLSHRKVKLGLKFRPNAKNKDTGGDQWRCNGDGKMRTQRTVHLLPNFTILDILDWNLMLCPEQCLFPRFGLKLKDFETIWDPWVLNSDKVTKSALKDFIPTDMITIIQDLTHIQDQHIDSN